MIYNYGGCVVFIKKPVPPLIIDDYIYTNVNGVVTLIQYIGSATNVVTPTVPQA